MKRFLAVFYVIILLFTVCSALSTESISWYFKPAKDGVQPILSPESSDFLHKYNVIALGNSDSKKIYLTFDAGYENGNVEKILNILKEKKVKGAFFVLPQLSKENKELLLRMKNEGHLVCNHTKTHRDMSKIAEYEEFKAELKEAEAIYKEATGYDMDRYYRPPEGRFSEENLKWANELGYTTVFWSLAYADWDNSNQMNPNKALRLITDRTHNGCVVLLHPTSATNVAILGDYIDIMRSKGYEFCSLSEFE